MLVYGAARLRARLPTLYWCPRNHIKMGSTEGVLKKGGVKVKVRDQDWTLTFLGFDVLGQWLYNYFIIMDRLFDGPFDRKTVLRISREFNPE